MTFFDKAVDEIDDENRIVINLDDDSESEDDLLC